MEIKPHAPSVLIKAAEMSYRSDGENVVQPSDGLRYPIFDYG